MTRALVLLLVLPWLAGCESVAYYRQAIGGHLGIMAAAKPVEAWLSDPSTPAGLRSRLELAQRIRTFASRELALPDNGTFTSYADLGRPYVVWNVFAAEEFSVKPRRECFPFAGCVSYRGFFAEADARHHAERLRRAGFDVYLGGVPAYSTLGWFDDPLLSSFISYPDAQLARLIFHELAHQVAYARAVENLTGANLMKLFPAPRIPTDKIPECRPHIERGDHVRLYRFSPSDYLELAAVFNGPHPETGEELTVVDEAPAGELPRDLPAEPSVFAPDVDPGWVAEVAATLRQKAGLPKQPTGEVARGTTRKPAARATGARAKAKAGARR